MHTNKTHAEEARGAQERLLTEVGCEGRLEGSWKGKVMRAYPSAAPKQREPLQRRRAGEVMCEEVYLEGRKVLKEWKNRERLGFEGH